MGPSTDLSVGRFFTCLLLQGDFLGLQAGAVSILDTRETRCSYLHCGLSNVLLSLFAHVSLTPLDSEILQGKECIQLSCVLKGPSEQQK